MPDETDGFDDFDAGELGILPSEPKPLPVPAFADYDPAHALSLPPREQFAEFSKRLAQLDEWKKEFRTTTERVYEAELEEMWRRVSPRGKKAFERFKAESDLGAAATELAEKHLLILKATEPAYLKAVSLVGDLIRQAADAVTIEPSESDYWCYEWVYSSDYSTQTNPLNYAEAKAMITAANVCHTGIKAEVKKHGETEKLPYFCVYVWCAERELPILRKRSGLPFADLVRLAWVLGANPRVFWPFLPHDYEAKHGFDQFGKDIPAPIQAQHMPLSEWDKPVGDLVYNTPAPPQSSEPPEPEPI
jgi:hypothetical protein